jgi:hypothetical protein
MSNSHRQPRAFDWVRRGWLHRAVDLDDVAVRIEEEELGVTGRVVAADKKTHRVVLRRVFAKTAASSRDGQRSNTKRLRCPEFQVSYEIGYFLVSEPLPVNILFRNMNPSAIVSRTRKSL